MVSAGLFKLADFAVGSVQPLCSITRVLAVYDGFSWFF
jgi:hypothetical protein